MNKKIKKTFILQIILTFISLFSSDNKLSSFLKRRPILPLVVAASAFYLTGIFTPKAIESYKQLENVLINEMIQLGIPTPINSSEETFAMFKLMISFGNKTAKNATDENLLNYLMHSKNVIMYGTGSIASGILGITSLAKIFKIKSIAGGLLGFALLKNTLEKNTTDTTEQATLN